MRSFIAASLDGISVLHSFPEHLFHDSQIITKPVICVNSFKSSRWPVGQDLRIIIAFEQILPSIHVYAQADGQIVTGDIQKHNGTLHADYIHIRIAAA